jgi:hypothetical protein
VNNTRKASSFAGALGGTVLALSLAAGGTAAAGGVPAVPVTAKPAAAHRAAPTSKSVAFKGQYRGTASLLINNGTVTISSVKGTGTGTLVGKSTVQGAGSASSSAQCDPFTGTGSIAGPRAKIKLTVTQSKSSGCSSGESGPVTVTFHGVAVATGGTGAAKGAKGTLKFSGSLKIGGTTGAENGPYNVSLSGTLTVA